MMATRTLRRTDGTEALLAEPGVAEEDILGIEEPRSCGTIRAASRADLAVAENVNAFRPPVHKALSLAARHGFEPSGKEWERLKSQFNETLRVSDAVAGDAQIFSAQVAILVLWEGELARACDALAGEGRNPTPKGRGPLRPPEQDGKTRNGALKIGGAS